MSERSDDPTDEAIAPTQLGQSDTLPSDPGGGGAAPLETRYGRFIVEGSLGSGGMGVVLIARDPELDRRVALKLLRKDVVAGDAAQARLVREAQAMARLSHPNVVTVYEVGRAGEQAFVAMELVTGQTMRSWLRERSRSWREVLAMFVAAGRGLAAAHAAGLIHRDVKPENILVGRDDRARVTDFGLVAGGVKPTPGAVDAAGMGSGLTLHGSAVGTPAYMSPEQWVGEAVDARSDQFSFCVALWEGVFGVRPFAATSGEEQVEQVREGRIAPPPSGRGVPGWLEAALRRGLAVRPEARWPSLARLLDELEDRAVGSRRVLKLVAVGAAALTAGLTVALLTRGDPADACPAPDGRLAPVWGAPRRDALRGRLAAIDPVQGAARFGAAAAVLDVAAAGWRDQHVAACRATRVEGRQSDTMLDLRMRCLDRWLRELDGTIGILERAGDPRALDEAIVAASQLSPLDACADTATMAAVPPPAGAAAQAEARAIEDEVDEVRLARVGGDLEGLATRASAVVEQARVLGHAPTLALALREQAYLTVELQDFAAVRTILEELAQVAAAAGDDATAAYAWTELIDVLGSDLQLPDDAKRLVPVARAAVTRAGDRLDLRVALLRAEASVIDGHGEAERALTLLEEARGLLIAAGADREDSEDANTWLGITTAMGSAYGSAGRHDESIAAFRDALVAAERMLGREHPETIKLHANLGETLRRADRLEESLAEYQVAARISEARVGESAQLIKLRVRVGGLLLNLDRTAEGVAEIEAALAVAERILDPDDPARIGASMDLGLGLRELGRFEEALARFDAGIAAHERRGSKSINVAIAYHNRGGVLKELSRWDLAIADYTHAVELIDATPGYDGHLVASLVSIGECHLYAGRPAAALAPLERARDVTAPERSERIQLHGGWLLGRARVESGGNRARGLAEVRDARAKLVVVGADAEELADLDAWLSASTR